MTFNRKLKLSLFLFLFFCYSFMWHKPNWNDLGRFDLIMAIVDRGTVEIDGYDINTGDKAIFNGHYYSDKAPGPAFLGVPIYWALNQTQDLLGWREGAEEWFINWIWYLKLLIIRILIIALPSALFGVLLFTFLSGLAITQRFAMWLTLGYTLGTLAFPYSSLFYGHQFAGLCVFTSFFIIFRLKDDSPKRIFWLWLSGFLAGYAVLSEYPVALLVCVLIVYLWMKGKNIKSMFAFIFGLTIPILILLYYNYLCSGNIFKLGYFQVAGEEFRREMNQGIAGVTYPKIHALWGITFSLYRGLFIINPLLILSIPGFYSMYQNKTWRKEFWVSLFVVILFFLFNSSYYMWWGGWAIGPRHLIPIIPFMVIPIAFIPRTYWKYIYGFIILSMVFMWMGTVIDPQVPDNSLNPLFGYVVDQLKLEKVSPNLGMFFFVSIPQGAYFLGIIIIIGSGMLLKKSTYT